MINIILDKIVQIHEDGCVRIREGIECDENMTIKELVESVLTYKMRKYNSKTHESEETIHNSYDNFLEIRVCREIKKDKGD